MISQTCEREPNEISQKFLKESVGETGHVEGRKEQPGCASGESESLPNSYQWLAERQG